MFLNDIKPKELRAAYEKACQADKGQFEYKGHSFVTDYAKYLLEYLELPNARPRV